MTNEVSLLWNTYSNFTLDTNSIFLWCWMASFRNVWKYVTTAFYTKPLLTSLKNDISTQDQAYDKYFCFLCDFTLPFGMYTLLVRLFYAPQKWAAQQLK